LVLRSRSAEENPAYGHDKVRLAVVTTYPPRRCGIASYSEQLLAHLGSLFALRLVAIGPTGALTCPPGPDLDPGQAFEPTSASYAQTARRLRDDVDCLLVQHEFGLYRGRDGRDVLSLLQARGRPAVVTLHTVLSTPTRGQRWVVSALAQLSARLIVFSQHARDLLEEVYRVPAAQVVVIPHGATIAAPDEMSSSNARSALGLSDRQVVLTSGFIGPNKGIDFALRAVELAARRHPRLLYAIVGQPHPQDAVAQEYARALEQAISRSALETMSCGSIVI